MTIKRVIQASMLAAIGLMGTLVACAPTPKSVPCSNGGDCEKADPKFAYCLEGRCVECVTNTSCGDKNTCEDGLCVRSCKDGRDCPQGESCSDGTCS